MNHTDTIRELLLEHPFGGPEFGGCECGQIIGGAQDVWADHLAPIIADTVTTKTNKGHEIADLRLDRPDEQRITVREVEVWNQAIDAATTTIRNGAKK
jgi:hypothetical protein